MYKRQQFTRLGKKAYPVPCSSPEKAIVTADAYVATAGHVPDIVFFDLSGTVNGRTPVSYTHLDVYKRQVARW